MWSRCPVELLSIPAECGATGEQAALNPNKAVRRGHRSMTANSRSDVRSGDAEGSSDKTGGATYMNIVRNLVE